MLGEPKSLLTIKEPLREGHYLDATLMKNGKS